MMDLVLNNAALIEEPEMRSILLNKCVDVARYQAVLKKWETSKIPAKRLENISIVNFSDQELVGIAAVRFSQLNAEQASPPGSTATIGISARRT